MHLVAVAQATYWNAPYPRFPAADEFGSMRHLTPFQASASGTDRESEVR
jgi:hypothetical protein